MNKKIKKLSMKEIEIKSWPKGERKEREEADRNSHERIQLREAGQLKDKKPIK
jgi:hypothetical protein